MDEWLKLMAGKPFITDIGEDRTVTVNDEERVMGRYAVWSPLKGRDGHTIVDVGSNLAALMLRYHVPSDRVCALACQAEK